MPRTYWMSRLPPEQYAEEIARRERLFTKYKKLGLKQADLIRKLEAQGLRTSKQELSAVFHGTRHGRKVDVMIDLIEKILAEEEHEIS